MFLPITEYLRHMARLMFSYTDIVKQRLLKFVEEVKSGKYTADQIAARSRIVEDNLRHFMKIKEAELSKSGDKLIPSQLVPKHLHGQQQIKDILKEVGQLYNSFLQQAKSPGQHKFLEDTVTKLIQCFDAIAGTLKAKTSIEKSQEHPLLEQQRVKRDRESLTSLSRLVDEMDLELGDQKNAKPARIILDMKKEIKKLTGI